MLSGPVREVRCSYMLVTHQSPAQDWWLSWRLQAVMRHNRKTSWESGVTGKQPTNHQQNRAWQIGGGKKDRNTCSNISLQIQYNAVASTLSTWVTLMLSKAVASSVVTHVQLWGQGSWPEINWDEVCMFQKWVFSFQGSNVSYLENLLSLW